MLIDVVVTLSLSTSDFVAEESLIFFFPFCVDLAEGVVK